MRRRTFVSGAGAAGAVLMSRPGGVLAGSLAGGTRSQVADRQSRLFPGSFLVHADMHNHTLFSDGDGDPSNASVSMRDHGLDVAALTDHSVLGGPLGVPFAACGSSDCKSIQGIDDDNWRDTLVYADDANAPESFVAIRGFEWSSPTLGHMNVWFSQDWIDPERTGGLVGVEGLELLTEEIPFIGPQVGEPLAEFVSDSPIAGIAMRPFFNWLNSAPGSGLFGGGADGIVGFNHPGREPGRFGAFHFDAALVDRVVSLEMFNRDEDYLFEGTDTDDPSPLNQCLNAGWRPGILGVTDEHGTDWGGPVDKGRGGIWIDTLSRDGVRAGMERRAFFATRERGLRFDASAASGTAAGPTVRMGSELVHTSGPVTFAIDLDKGTEWIGKPLRLQVLRPGGPSRGLRQPVLSGGRTRPAGGARGGHLRARDRRRGRDDELACVAGDGRNSHASRRWRRGRGCGAGTVGQTARHHASRSRSRARSSQPLTRRRRLSFLGFCVAWRTCVRYSSEYELP